jgi:hypothetical protein
MYNVHFDVDPISEVKHGNTESANLGLLAEWQ